MFSLDHGSASATGCVPFEHIDQQLAHGQVQDPWWEEAHQSTLNAIFDVVIYVLVHVVHHARI